MPEKTDNLQFIGGQYFATGEGSTIMILITRAYPRQDDYSTPSTFEDGKFTPGVLGNTAKFRAAREFVEKYGGYMAQVGENLPRAEFLEKYGRWVPEPVLKALDSDSGNLNYSAEFHINFS